MTTINMYACILHYKVYLNQTKSMKGFLNFATVFGGYLKSQEMATKYAFFVYFLHFAKSHLIYVDFDIKVGDKFSYKSRIFYV